MFGTCMSLSRMTSPCTLIRLTIISFIVSTVVVFYGLYLASLLRAYDTVMGDSPTACMPLYNDKVGCDDVYSFCESQTSY